VRSGLRSQTVARILLIGGGARGRALGGELTGDGHVVRITTRTEAGRAVIEAVGAECWIGTPDRIATLRRALDGVTVACWLLGSATGSPAELDALHGSRLQFFATQTIDTTIRGLLYEAAGSVGAARLEHGRELLLATASQNQIPLAVIDADPSDPPAWRAAARHAIDALLAPRG
jgi:hypothetical protein